MSNDKKQTAVEWLFQETLGITLQLTNKRISHRNWELQMVKLHEQAKEMEKHRMIEFTNEWFEEYQCGLDNFKNPEKYYNETYGGGEQ